MEHFIGAIKKYADFTGRARRTEYWMFTLFYIIFSLVVSAIDYALGTTVLGLIYSLGLLLPSIAVAARRLHDTDRSGWWQLLAFIPIIGWIVLLVFYCQDSEVGDNRFGSNPKELG
ncbi:MULTISPECIES: DUF805 domain-containing protein [Shewanella]|jgi:uncharacterized membrane protein YhaH (DUF805 family)|uniref:DUF805 domain-containing protein n=1 Tax=Shewanella algae TaxID=38313 RepID=A0A2T3H4T8_9GAMM|nr:MULTISPECIES: DUF805 domain-containing protein [Shewanella]AXQ16486.1 hypothetical protein BS332_02575 [Shewanella algae]AYV15872.1 DUF805 domain-containing protein [Shewanella algae]EKT4487165.1 DUF805 domain-containing protein [Shewanella algae]MBC8797829.1 DUF805 domain-containing protein [Shewanella algae]MBO2549113.1 DUF805 domain-containing protein [Shewanella algae]